MTAPMLTVCVDARLSSGEAGGVESAVIGLASGLASLDQGNERYLFLTRANDSDWLRPYLSGPCSVLEAAATNPTLSAVRTGLSARWPRLGRVVSGLRSRFRRGVLPNSDGTIEAAGVDLMHFLLQGAFLTKVPSIYHPHDLQHVHLPENFSPEGLAWREAACGSACRQAKLVAVTSSWIQQDVTRHYQLAEGHVQVIPFAPPTTSYPDPSERDLRAARERMVLPESFAFYPAQTWPHKNHLAMLRAAARVRDSQHLHIPLVFSGKQNEYYPVIEREARQLGLAEQVRFVGFVSPLEIQCLYRLARFVVVPSRFEAASFPVWEAFQAGTPCACASVTSLPAQAGDAALLFDPDDVAGLADIMYRLWTDPTLRTELVARGRVRVSEFTWERSARHFRAHYRRLAQRPLDADDEAILAAPPLL